MKQKVWDPFQVESSWLLNPDSSTKILNTENGMQGNCGWSLPPAKFSHLCPLQKTQENPPCKSPPGSVSLDTTGRFGNRCCREADPVERLECVKPKDEASWTKSGGTLTELILPATLGMNMYKDV